MDGLAFDDLKLFARVAALGTLSAVARERDVPVSQVSRALTRIEKTCGARLIHRSTHGLALTVEGESFLEHSRRIAGLLESLEAEFATRSREASGLVRVAASTVVAQYLLLPSLQGLNARHPRLRVELEVSDRLVDMARDGIDIAIRTGSAQSEALVARPIGGLTRALYAAPAYVRRHGLPRQPDDLMRHRLIGNTTSAALNRWAWRGGGKSDNEFIVQGHTRTDNTAVVVALAQQGVGIARIVDLVAQPLVKIGALVPVLPEHFSTKPVPMFAVMLQERHRLPKIRACIDHWAQWMAQHHGAVVRERRR
jgi:DNA-binding transcriptional LysR family regulator